MNNIPIIGQPEVLDFTVSVLIKCPCGNHFILTGNVGSSRPCGMAGCKKAYQIGTVPIDPTSNAPIVLSGDGSRVRVNLLVGTVDA